jgi:signal transduction histidine kinase
MYRHWSINRKLLLVVLTTTVAALLITGLALALYDLHTYRLSLVDDLGTQADILGLAAAPALDFEDRQSAQDYLNLLQAKPGIVAAAIYTSSGKLFAEYRRTGYRSNIDIPAIPEADGYSVQGNDILLFRRIVSNGEILGTVYARARYARGERLFDYAGIVTIVTVLSLLAALLMSRWLQRGITQPLEAITSVARDVVEHHDFRARVPKTTDNEIGVLVDAFNKMLSEIGDQTETQQRANDKLARTEERLRHLNAELERRVADRTRDLETANNDLEAFSYSVSHDLRAPIRAITGFCSLLEADHRDQLDDEARRKLGIVRDEAGRMGQLIDDLLAFSRLGRKALQLTEIDMMSVVEGLWGRLGETVGDNVEFRLGSLPHAYGDLRLLEQVWINLLSNAVKFSANKEKPVIEIGGLTDKDELVYFVRDNGAGFDAKYAGRLFGVFQRLHGEDEFSGTGVGLAIVHKIVSRHGGRIWGDGKPGEGASFHFTLPRRKTDGQD